MLQRHDSSGASGSAAPASSASGTRHTIVPGDCVESLAARHGFYWETIWAAEANRELRDRRDNHHHLLPGDVLVIPERIRREETGAAGSKHRFRRRGATRFRLQLRRCGQPRIDIPFRLVLEECEHTGRTDDQGWVDVPIPATAHEGELILFEGEPGEEIIEIRLGALDPIDEISGVQGRLRNLGYDCEITGELDELTRAAIEEFQEEEELEITGEPDDATRERLTVAHHS